MAAACRSLYSYHITIRTKIPVGALKTDQHLSAPVLSTRSAVNGSTAWIPIARAWAESPRAAPATSIAPSRDRSYARSAVVKLRHGPWQAHPEARRPRHRQRREWRKSSPGQTVSSRRIASTRLSPEWVALLRGLVRILERVRRAYSTSDTSPVTRHEPMGSCAAYGLNSRCCSSPGSVRRDRWPVHRRGEPSEFASASTLEFAALTMRPAFPDGGSTSARATGRSCAALVDHPCVSKITFNRLRFDRRQDHRRRPRALKRVSLEGGGGELGGSRRTSCCEDCDLGSLRQRISGISRPGPDLHRGLPAAGPTPSCRSSARRRRSSAVQRAGRSDCGKGLPTSVTVTRRRNPQILDYMGIAKDRGARCILGGGAAT